MLSTSNFKKLEYRVGVISSTLDELRFVYCDLSMEERVDDEFSMCFSLWLEDMNKLNQKASVLLYKERERREKRDAKG